MDEIIIPTQVHLLIGGLALLASLVAVVVTGRGSLGPGRWGKAERGVFIAAQIVLMVQALIGIKLLDQGMGTVQKYVHYLGGLGALGLLVMSYWRPRPTAQGTARQALGLSAASLVFVALTFFVGGMYARG